MGKQQLEILTDMADSMVVGNQLLDHVAEQLESISEQMLQPGSQVNRWKEFLTENRARSIVLVSGTEIPVASYNDEDITEDFIVVTETSGWVKLLPYKSIAIIAV